MTILYALALVAVGLWVMRPERTARPSARATGPMSARELAGLVSIDWDDELVLVTPRLVELPTCDQWHPDWDLDSVCETLAEVDAL